MVKKYKQHPKATLLKVDQIHIPKFDLPESGVFPPNSGAFDDLKRTLKDKGLALPIFVNKDRVLLSGHYRFWAWQALGKKHIHAIIVDSKQEITDFFEKG